MNRLSLIFVFWISLIFISGVIFLTEYPGYRIEFEGLVTDRNLRDVSESLRECSIQKKMDAVVLKDGLLLRSNHRFSGWACDEHLNPKNILTLNFEPKRPRTYFCVDTSTNTVRSSFIASKAVRLNDIEFASTWDNSSMRHAICGSLKFALEKIGSNESTLVHCEAGRDRTGAVTALLAAIALEETMNIDAITTLIECDYRKSKSLNPVKYGRMEQMILRLHTNHGSVGQAVEKICHLQGGLVSNFRSAFISR